MSVLHGRLSRLERSNIVAAFRAGTFRALVATDLAARGLDLPDCDTVINMGLAPDALAYAHRAGRAGRAGAPGVVASVVSRAELPALEAAAARLGVTLQVRIVGVRGCMCVCVRVCMCGLSQSFGVLHFVAASL